MSGQDVPVSMTAPLLELRAVSRTYRSRDSAVRSSLVRALDAVSLLVVPGATTCIVGETGSGKTTLGRLLLGLTLPTSGSVLFRGQLIKELDRAGRADYRRSVQMVFQSPIASFNPMLTIGGSLRDALRFAPRPSQGRTRQTDEDLLELVGLPREFSRRYPDEVSGGELQRASIARALATDPSVIFLDEPASALDASIRGQIFNVLLDLQRDRGLAYVMVSHDLGSARALADRLVVMYLGRVVETVPTRTFFAGPSHPYALALLAASGTAVGRVELRGDIPSATAPPPGCQFHTRCWLYQALGEPERCRTDDPELALIEPDHVAACHFATETLAVARSGSDTTNATPPAGEVHPDGRAMEAEP